MRVKFYAPDKDSKEKIFKLEDELLKEGVYFDTGYDFQTCTREWELDSSYEGRISKEEVIERAKKLGLKMKVEE